MQRLRLIIFALLVSVLFMSVSCVNTKFDPDKWDIDQVLNLSSTCVAFSSEAATDTVCIQTNYLTYSLSIIYDEDNADGDWCKVTKLLSDSSFVVQVSPNKSTEQRKATISVKIGHNQTTEVYLPVVQMGGKWEVIGPFTLFLTHEISASQKELLSELLNSMVKVEGGSFEMGRNTGYNVNLDDYYIGKYELTQAQWMAIMGTNPSKYVGSDHPVENVTWSEAMQFCKRLSSLTGLSFNLPTEAQWEYAARGGKYSYDYIYSGSNDHEEVAHIISGIDEDSPLFTTVEVGTKLSNELGLYDMSGNVAEFCFDYYEDYPSDSYPYDNPSGPSTGNRHVTRGGSFRTSAVELEGLTNYLDVRTRDYCYDSSSSLLHYGEVIGLRVVLVL